MALPKSKSRKIVVSDVEYRYAISVSWKDDGLFDFNITVQNEENNGCKLLLKGLVTRDFWLDFSENIGEAVERSSYPTITPKHIAHFIYMARQQGWKHTAQGADFTLLVNNKGG